ncbi:hypothetical protein BC830DRAFT_1131287 [Chytriomyces sp. MP71]|nr:hypothetical protein BC830DRAFT_1131287 [Chytriomyces sp. MP71]
MRNAPASEVHEDPALDKRISSKVRIAYFETTRPSDLRATHPGWIYASVLTVNKLALASLHRPHPSLISFSTLPIRVSMQRFKYVYWRNIGGERVHTRAYCANADW